MRSLRGGRGADDDVALHDGEPGADLVSHQAAIEFQRADFRLGLSGQDSGQPKGKSNDTDEAAHVYP